MNVLAGLTTIFLACFSLSLGSFLGTLIVGRKRK